MSASFALQQAVWTALAGDTDVAALVGERIYDEVPRAAGFPYLSLGEGQMADWSTKTDTGGSLVFTVTAWSRNPGFAEAKTIADAVRAALDRAALVPEGITLVDCAFQSVGFARLRDGVSRSATLRFRALIEF